jgi:hypothetical protein
LRGDVGRERDRRHGEDGAAELERIEIIVADIRDGLCEYLIEGGIIANAWEQLSDQIAVIPGVSVDELRDCLAVASASYMSVSMIGVCHDVPFR